MRGIENAVEIGVSTLNLLCFFLSAREGRECDVSGDGWPTLFAAASSVITCGLPSDVLCLQLLRPASAQPRVTILSEWPSSLQMATAMAQQNSAPPE